MAKRRHGGSSLSKDIPETPEKIAEESEMCDVCCKTYHYTDIKRVTWIHPKRGTTFVIRVCPYCNIEGFVKRLL